MNKNLSFLLFLIFLYYLFDVSLSSVMLILIWGIFRMKQHFSLMLINFELMSMIIMISIILFMSNFQASSIFFFSYLCISVGEACLGLVMLIFYSRMFSSEMLMNHIF